MKTITLEELVLAHRHLYYIGRPVISDREYDVIETLARRLLPMDSEVHKSGGESDSRRIQTISLWLEQGKFISNLVWCVKSK